MLICPTCRNQNLDTAKFCGNCGNSFTRQSASTSSLINCSQGHVYSAVYEHCPYCPQPQFDTRDSDFATRIETPATTIDSPRVANTSLYSSSQNTTEFSTRVDTRENAFETLESPSLPPPAPPVSTIIPAFSKNEAPPLIPSSETPVSAPLDPFRISGILETPAITSETWHTPTPAPAIASETWNTPAPTPAQTLAPTPAQTLAPQVVPSTLDRRSTTMLTDQSAPARKSKGRIVGWLVTFSHNPDGEDFRIYAGYNRIGANPVCDVQIEDETVSGSHAIIVYRDGRCLIKDDLSRNGTFVNGREITEAQPLQSYDQVRVGNTNLVFVAAARVE
jgi:FHA domain